MADDYAERLARAKRINAAYKALPPLPCGCKPSLRPCRCPDKCWCPVELVFCTHAKDWPDDSLDEIRDRLAEFYIAADPENYADRPQSAGLIEYTWKEARIEMMADRVALGLSPFHEGDIKQADIGQGETAYSRRWVWKRRN